jgi:NhaP-type Na+/H+ or K+/H+ antiporter
MIFVFLGVSAVSRNHSFNFPFTTATLGILVLVRFTVTALLTAVVNRGRLDKIGPVDQFIMAYGGMRGAESFGLVMSLNAEAVGLKALFTTTTIIVIFFTVFVQVQSIL